MHRDPDDRELQADALVDDLARQLRQQFLDIAEPAIGDHRQGAALDDGGGAAIVAGCQRVAHRLGGDLLAQIPFGGGQMQRRDRRRIALLELAAQKIAEEMVVAIPASLIVQPHDEELARFHHSNHRLGLGKAQDRGAAFGGKPLQHRGLHQEILQAGIEHAENLLHQEFGDFAPAPGKAGQRFAGGQLQRRELQAGGPAFGLRYHQVEQIRGETGAQPVGQEQVGIAAIEAQLLDADFHQAPGQPQPRQRHRRNGAGGDDQMHSAIQHQPLDDTDDGGVFDEMQVVEEQGQRLRQSRRHLADFGDHRIDEQDRAGAQRFHQHAAARQPRAKGGFEMGDEDVFVIVLKIERQPGGGFALFCHPTAPLRHQHGLAETGGGADQRQRGIPAAAQPVQKPRARNPGTTLRRRVQFGIANNHSPSTRRRANLTAIAPMKGKRRQQVNHMRPAFLPPAFARS